MQAARVQTFINLGLSLGYERRLLRYPYPANLHKDKLIRLNSKAAPDLVECNRNGPTRAGLLLQPIVRHR